MTAIDLAELVDQQIAQPQARLAKRKSRIEFSKNDVNSEEAWKF